MAQPLSHEIVHGFCHRNHRLVTSRSRMTWLFSMKVKWFWSREPWPLLRWSVCRSRNSWRPPGSGSGDFLHFRDCATGAVRPNSLRSSSTSFLFSLHLRFDVDLWRSTHRLLYRGQGNCSSSHRPSCSRKLFSLCGRRFLKLLSFHELSRSNPLSGFRHGI